MYIQSGDSEIIYADSTFALCEIIFGYVIKRRGISEITGEVYLDAVSVTTKLSDYFSNRLVFSYASFSDYLYGALGITINQFVPKNLLSYSMKEVGALIEADIYNFTTVLNYIGLGLGRGEVYYLRSI